MVDRQLRMALVDLSNDRREEVLSANKECNRLCDKSQVRRESFYFITIHTCLSAVM